MTASRSKLSPGARESHGRLSTTTSPTLAGCCMHWSKREERISLQQLEEVVPDEPAGRDPTALLAAGVRRFLEAVASRPATWRIILLPLEGTPSIVRDHVEMNRARTQARIARLVEWTLERDELPNDLDVELTARAIRVMGEDAGRTLLTDPDWPPPSATSASCARSWGFCLRRRTNARSAASTRLRVRPC